MQNTKKCLKLFYQKKKLKIFYNSFFFNNFLSQPKKNFAKTKFKKYYMCVTVFC